MQQTLNLQTLHPLKDYTTLKIGGAARFFCQIETEEQYLEVLNLSHQKKLPIFVLGKGSNTLFIDDIFEAIVVLNRIHHLKLDLPYLECGSGYNITLLSAKASRKGFSGLEGAAGIPASVGGAIYMNAGAGSFETKDHLKWVKTIDDQGRKHVRSKEDIQFSYRYSQFQEWHEFITEAAFELEPSSDAWSKQQAILKKRIQSQPYQDFSAGCFFKNPQGHSAGAIIDQSGLKGLGYKGASVSKIHANFLINADNSSASNLLKLAEIVKNQVFEKTGIWLEQEVKLVGNFLYEKV